MFQYISDKTYKSFELFSFVPVKLRDCFVSYSDESLGYFLKLRFEVKGLYNYTFNLYNTTHTQHFDNKILSSTENILSGV